MDCLVLISATRKALFTNDETKNQFLDRMMQGIQDIIKTVDDPDCYLRFCRLLYRFRTNAPLSEMATKPNYLSWIQTMADFTKIAFDTTFDESTFYLLGFWSRIIHNMSYCHYLSEPVTKKLQLLSVELTQSFITAACNLSDEGITSPTTFSFIYLAIRSFGRRRMANGVFEYVGRISSLSIR